MDRWEYMRDRCDIDTLNKYGKEGWEVVNFDNQGGYTMKRKLEPIEPQKQNNNNLNHNYSYPTR